MKILTPLLTSPLAGGGTTNTENLMKKSLILFCIFLLTACGWHLRGSNPQLSSKMEWVNISITADDEHTALFTYLRPLLDIYRLKEVADDTATTNLQIQKLLLDKRTAGVGADALTSAYELTLSVEYRLVKEVQSTDKMTRASVTRTYNYNLNNANGAAQEEALILREMHRELAQQILRRTRLLLNKQSTAEN
jgi:LPS-assembly lipoprotein